MFYPIKNLSETLCISNQVQKEIKLLAKHYDSIKS